MNLKSTPTLLAGAGVLTLGTMGFGATVGSRKLLTAQALVTRERIGKPFGDLPPASNGVYRKRYAANGEPVSLLVLGDSIAAGLGAVTKHGTLGVKVAKRLGDLLQRPVALRVEAVSGSVTHQVVESQLPRLEDSYTPDYVLMVVGANDVIHRVRQENSIAALNTVIQVLERKGTRLVVATCPNFAVVQVMPRPLRSFVSLASQRLAAGQNKLLENRGVTHLRLGKILTKSWKSQATVLFSEDHYHPSAKGYTILADRLAPLLESANRLSLPKG